MKYDVIIVGAGAAGLMCAIEAGKRGKKTLIIEHSKNIGEKIRISGGGRCNFTNIHATPKNYISNNPHFVVSALSRYTPHDFIKLVESYNIDYHEKTLGQLFCNGKSQQIIEMLVNECSKYSVEFMLNCKINYFNYTDNVFQIKLNSGLELLSNSFVIASGGLSIPKIGASPFGYEVAKKFDINIINTRAGLVPFILNNNYLIELAGVAVKDVIVNCNKNEFREAMLFTHKGLSGPAILQISSYWDVNSSIFINLFPNGDLLQIINNNMNTELPKILNQYLPKSLVSFLVNKYDINGKPVVLKNSRLKEIKELLENWEIIPDDTEGYRTAEVTLGGVDTNELSSKTFESKKIKGLYFIGEVLDVTGHLGGYNFQWAWSSGHAAGQYV